jgi:hypothetical protein
MLSAIRGIRILGSAAAVMGLAACIIGMFLPSETEIILGAIA